MEVFFKKYFWVVTVLVVAGCAMFAGRAVSHLIEGAWLTGDVAHAAAPRRMAVAPLSKLHTKDVARIVKRDIFCSGCAPPPDVQPTAAGPTSNEPQKTTLQLELVSIMLCPTDSTWSMAVIRDLSTPQKDASMYATGSEVAATGATVASIEPTRVYLRNHGRLEYLELQGDAPAPATPSYTPAQPAANASLGDITSGVTCSGNACTVDRSLVEKLLSNTAMLATAARFVPSIKDGRPNGFKLYAIRPQSIFGKIGLQNGDTIKEINGLDMSTPDKALEIYTKLRYASHLSVTVERRGQTQTLDYSIR